MDYSDYQLARVQVAEGVASVIINNPPINIFDLPLYGELAKLGIRPHRVLEADLARSATASAYGG